MEKIYSFKIQKNIDNSEDHEINDRNIMMAQIIAPDGNILFGKGYLIQLTFSKDAMIGFGKELIRLAFNGDFADLIPSREESKYLEMGVFLHPKSCQLIVEKYDFKKIDEECVNSSI